MTDMFNLIDLHTDMFNLRDNIRWIIWSGTDDGIPSDIIADSVLALEVAKIPAPCPNAVYHQNITDGIESPKTSRCRECGNTGIITHQITLGEVVEEWRTGHKECREEIQRLLGRVFELDDQLKAEREKVKKLTAERDTARAAYRKLTDQCAVAEFRGWKEE